MLDSLRMRALVGMVLLGGLGLGSPALAEIKWSMTGAYQTATTVTSSTDCGSSCASVQGNTRTFSGGASNPTVTAQAWSNTGNNTNTTQPPVPSVGTLETAYLGLYGGGLGAKNRDGNTAIPNTGDGSEWATPEHAVDNQQRFDSVLFSFSSAVDLNKVEIGYLDTDSDITVLAYTGGNGLPAVPAMTGTYSGLTSQGWTFIGHYTDLVLNSPVSINPGNVSSAYWLIAPYVPAWGTTTYSVGNDAVKLLALYGDKPSNGVPEPNALLLLGIAMMGVWTTRRTRRVPA